YYAFTSVVIDHCVSVVPAHSNIYADLFAWGAGIAGMPPIGYCIGVSPGVPYLWGSSVQAAGDSEGFGHISCNHGVSPSRGNPRVDRNARSTPYAVVQSKRQPH